MVAPIVNALSRGFTATSVLKKVIDKYPRLATFATAATAAGFSPARVLKKIADPRDEDESSHEIITMHAKTQEEQQRLRNQDRLRPLKALGTVGAAVGGIHALSKIGQRSALAKSIEEEAPQLIKEGMGASTASNPAEEIISPAPEQRTPERERLLKIAENLPEEKPKAVVGEGIKPLQIDTPIVQIPRVETQFPHIRKFVDKHLAAGKSPEDIYENIQKSGLKGIADRHTQQTGQSYLDRIKELAGDQGSKPTEVITPLGAGTIHNEKGDNAFVKIDNKLHKIPKNELEEPPKSAVEAVTNYLNIPEKDRSSNVALFAWNPDERRAYFQFHNEDSFYEYTDVDPAVVDAIAEKRAIPKTQGGNEYGVWSQEDEESIGAALWKYIISTPKYAKNKKGEPVNPYYKKLPIKYDYWQKLRKPVRRKKSGG